VFIVGLLSHDGAFSGNPGTTIIPSEVNNWITTTLTNSGKLPTGVTAQPLDGSADTHASPTDLPELMSFDTAAVASYQLVDTNNNNAVDTNNVDLKAAVNAVNAAVKNQTSALTLSTGPTVWLIGATADLLGMGGSILDHVAGSPGGAPSTTGLPSAPKWLAPSGSSSAQDVYILDTAPGASLCLDTPPAGAPPAPGQSCSLINLNEYAISAPQDLDVGGYPYRDAQDLSFQQHGQFVGEIVRAMAPGAKLHLIGVLNQYGAGDIRTLIAGLRYVFDNAQPGAVVNMSLDIEPPTACLMNMWSDAFGATLADTITLTPTQNTVLVGPQGGNQQKSGSLQKAGSSQSAIYTATDLFNGCANYDFQGALSADPQDARLYAPLGLAIAEMVSHQYQLVAAAGNDSADAAHVTYPVSPRFGADMPAAFCGATAVAGISSNQLQLGGTQPTNLTPFSNLPYQSVTSGSVCLSVPISFSTGGPPDAIANPVNPMSAASSAQAYALGYQVCSFFQASASGSARADANSSDMTAWSGTSFATAFVSGYLSTHPSAGAVLTTVSAPCG
jgi:hypothetical protein